MAPCIPSSPQVASNKTISGITKITTDAQKLKDAISVCKDKSFIPTKLMKEVDKGLQKLDQHKQLLIKSVAIMDGSYEDYQTEGKCGKLLDKAEADLDEFKSGCFKSLSKANQLTK